MFWRQFFTLLCPSCELVSLAHGRLLIVNIFVALDVLQGRDAAISMSSPALTARVLIFAASAMETETVAMARTNSTAPLEVTMMVANSSLDPNSKRSISATNFPYLLVACSQNLNLFNVLFLKCMR
jgi:hypothetical protein